MVLLRIDSEATRDDLVTSIFYYNDRAKHVSRRGRAGTASESYKDLHETLDALTDAILMYDSIPA